MGAQTVSNAMFLLPKDIINHWKYPSKKELNHCTQRVTSQFQDIASLTCKYENVFFVDMVNSAPSKPHPSNKTFSQIVGDSNTQPHGQRRKNFFYYTTPPPPSTFFTVKKKRRKRETIVACLLYVHNTLIQSLCTPPTPKQRKEET